MKKTAIILVLICCYISAASQFRESLLVDKSFKAGEKLIYTVKFGPIIGGNASLEVKQVYLNNKTVYYAKGEGKTVGLAEKLYSVKDIFESYFDIKTFLPYKAVRDVKEGTYTKHEEAIFDHASGTVYSTRNDTVIQIPPNTVDMVSLLYYVRNIDLRLIKPGDVLHTITFFDEEIFPFDIRYKGKEEIKCQFGKIKCHRFDPVVEPGRMFESEDDMTIWFSDDKNMVPVKVRFDLVVGSLRMELTEYANLKYPLAIITEHR
jgi:hypothetical protein